MTREQYTNPYTYFFKSIIHQKEYLIILCLKEMQVDENDIDKLYEGGIIALYYAFKLFYFSDNQEQSFDFLAYQFIIKSMQEQIKTIRSK